MKIFTQEKNEPEVILPIMEDGDACANASGSGMGAVVSAQPSTNSGVTTEPGYSAGGGTIGSGDISNPMNGNNIRKTSPRNNSRRRKRMVASLKNFKSQKDAAEKEEDQGTVKSKKIMNFDSFSKNKFDKVTKIEDL